MTRGNELKLVFPQVESEAHPSRFEDLDFEHFAEYTADIDARGVTTAVADYLARYVHAPATWDEYLELFGGERLKRAQDAARELVPGA